MIIDYWRVVYAPLFVANGIGLGFLSWLRDFLFECLILMPVPERSVGNEEWGVRSDTAVEYLSWSNPKDCGFNKSHISRFNSFSRVRTYDSVILG